MADSELSEELFDSALVSLYNHKSLYKGNQLELASAQEQAHSSGLTQVPSSGNLQPAYQVPAGLNNSTFIRQG